MSQGVFCHYFSSKKGDVLLLGGVLLIGRIRMKFWPLEILNFVNFLNPNFDIEILTTKKKNERKKEKERKRKMQKN